MNFINNAYQIAQNYWQDLPQDMAEQTVYQAAAAGMIWYIISADPKHAMINGGLMALVIVIQGCVSPIFKRMIAPRTILTLGEAICRSLIPIFVIETAIYAYSSSTFRRDPRVMWFTAGMIGLNILINPALSDVNHAGMLF